MKNFKLLFLSFIFLLSTSFAFATMQQTTWSPDTCNKCQVVYEWDDAVPQEQRVHTPIEVKNVPADFKGDSKAVQFDKILEENQRKNKAISEVAKEHPELTDEKGSLKSDVPIDFHYDENHVLHLKVGELNKQDKEKAKEKVDETVGAEKVILE